VWGATRAISRSDHGWGGGDGVSDDAGGLCDDADGVSDDADDVFHDADDVFHDADDVFHDADDVFHDADDVFYDAHVLPRHEFVNYMTVSHQPIGLTYDPRAETWIRGR
jgi:hypothetical protein